MPEELFLSALTNISFATQVPLSFPLKFAPSPCKYRRRDDENVLFRVLSGMKLATITEQPASASSHPSKPRSESNASQSGFRTGVHGPGWEL